MLDNFDPNENLLTRAIQDMLTPQVGRNPFANAGGGLLKAALDAGQSYQQGQQALMQGDPMAAIGGYAGAAGSLLQAPQRAFLAAGGTTPEQAESVGGNIAESVGVNRHLGEFAAGVLTDPTSYIGVGLGKAAATRAAKMAPGAGKAALETVAALDAGLSEGGGAAAGALIKAIQEGPLGAVNAGLGKVFPELPKWTEFATKSKAILDATQWLEQRHGLDLTAARGIAASAGVSELHKLLPTELGQQVSSAELSAILTASAKAKNAPVPASFADATAEHLKQVRESMGLVVDNKFRRGYAAFTDWYKRQALGSINYLTTNLQGGAFLGMLEGVDPRTVGRAAWEHKGDIARGTDFDTSGAAGLAAKTGMPIPESLNYQAEQALQSIAGSTGSMRGDMARDAGIVGGLGAIGEGAEGLLTGGVVGAALRPFTDRTRAAAQGIETVLRQSGWQKGMSDELIASLDEMETVIRDALSQPRASGSVPNQAFADGIVQTLRSKQGQMSVDDIARAMTGGARARPEVAQDAARRLDDIFYRASRAGVDKSNRFNFDYQDLSNVERVIAEAFPFSTWMLKAAPFLGEQAARHPALFNAKREWDQESEEARKERGLTSRVTGALPNPIGSTILSAVLGRDVEVWQNPFQSLIPFADAERGLERVEYAEGAGGKGLALLQALGLGLNPIMDTAARVANITDPDEPTKGYLRLAGPVAALTGVDLNKGSQKIEEAVRETVSGREVTNLNEVAVAKRMDELALRATGKAIGSGDPAVAPYVRAKATQSGELWDQAQREVAQERGVGAVAGFVSQNLRPQATITEEESAIRGSTTRTLIAEEQSKAIRDAAKANPAARASAAHVEAVRRASLAIIEQTGRPMPPQVVERLNEPTNENVEWIAGQIYLWQTQNSEPLLRGYTGSGAPEKRRVQRQQAELTTAGQIPTYMETGGLQNPFRLPNKLKRTEQEAITGKNLDLATYLAWKRLNPTGDIEQFLAEQR